MSKTITMASKKHNKAHHEGETLDLLFAVMKRIRGEISIPQMKALLFVTEHDNPSMKAIADYFGITPPSATSMVNKLVTEGKLERHMDDKDRRTVRINITPLGKKVLQDSIRIMQEGVGKLMKSLSDDEKKTFVSILKKLTATQ